MQTQAPGQPGLIFGPGPSGWWDSERVSCPRVLANPTGSGWLMWYYGRDPTFERRINMPTGRVGLAQSHDGVAWERVKGPLVGGSVFGPADDSDRFDSGHVGISDIHWRDGVYWMWYLGGDLAGQFPGFPLQPGCAISRDGLNWARIDGPHRGALLEPGPPGSWDEFMVGWPQVIPWPNGTWRMYYHTVQIGQGYVLGWAESRDGLSWEKRGPLMGPGPKGRFDDFGVATRHILKLGERWTMLYEGCHDIGEPFEVDRQIGVAVSDDGLEWERIDGPYDNGSVLPQSAKGSGLWDFRLGCPWAVPLADGSLRLYYIGSNERPGSGGSELDTRHQIGLATSGGSITEWQRYRA